MIYHLAYSQPAWYREALKRFLDRSIRRSVLGRDPLAEPTVTREHLAQLADTLWGAPQSERASRAARRRRQGFEEAYVTVSREGTKDAPRAPATRIRTDDGETLWERSP